MLAIKWYILSGLLFLGVTLYAGLFLSLVDAVYAVHRKELEEMNWSYQKVGWLTAFVLVLFWPILFLGIGRPRS